MALTAWYRCISSFVAYAYVVASAKDLRDGAGPTEITRRHLVSGLSVAPLLTEGDVAHAEIRPSAIRTKYYNDLVESLPPLDGKCVAITGTTSGLGYWAAVATARKGAECLIMLNRASERASAVEDEIRNLAASGVKVFTVVCDLADMSSVRGASDRVNEIVGMFGGLDVLALNAGIMHQPDERTIDGFDLTMQTNHLSQFLLTKLLMPSLNLAAVKGREVRIVTHSSILRGTLFGGKPMDERYYGKSAAGTLGGDADAARFQRYHQSKLANIAYAMAFHAKIAGLPRYGNFKIVSAAPGVSDTSLDISVPIGPLTALSEEKSLRGLFFSNAADGSCSLLTAMYSPSANSGDFYEPDLVLTGPPLKVISGGVPLPVGFPRLLFAQDLRDGEVCANETLAKVWQFSEEALGEKFAITGELSDDVSPYIMAAFTSSRPRRSAFVPPAFAIPQRPPFSSRSLPALHAWEKLTAYRLPVVRPNAITPKTYSRLPSLAVITYYDSSDADSIGMHSALLLFLFMCIGVAFTMVRFQCATSNTKGNPCPAR